jgi:hypothetical protein
VMATARVAEAKTEVAATAVGTAAAARTAHRKSCNDPCFQLRSRCACSCTHRRNSPAAHTHGSTVSEKSAGECTA